MREETIMFLVDHAPQLVSRTRTFTSRVRVVVPIIYDWLFRPMSEVESIYLAMSSEIQHLRHHTVDERRLMHEYASSLLMHDGTWPEGMDRQLTCRVEAILQARRDHYRRLHPVLTRRKVAA